MHGIHPSCPCIDVRDQAPCSIFFFVASKKASISAVRFFVSSSTCSMSWHQLHSLLLFSLSWDSKLEDSKRTFFKSFAPSAVPTILRFSSLLICFCAVCLAVRTATRAFSQRRATSFCRFARVSAVGLASSGRDELEGRVRVGLQRDLPRNSDAKDSFFVRCLRRQAKVCNVDSSLHRLGHLFRHRKSAPPCQAPPQDGEKTHLGLEARHEQRALAHADARDVAQRIQCLVFGVGLDAHRVQQRCRE